MINPHTVSALKESLRYFPRCGLIHMFINIFSEEKKNILHEFVDMYRSEEQD